MKPLSAGQLAERLAVLPVLIEGHTVELGSVPIERYYGGRPRPTGELTLIGGGQVGRGENVDWTAEEQARFADVCDEFVPRSACGADTAGAVSRALLESGAGAHHRAAIEAGAIDLALKQASTDLFELSGRPVLPVRHCWSIGREDVERGCPEAAVARLLKARPEARIKIDCPPGGWPEPTWRTLAAGGRIVVVDFKREGLSGQIALAHRYLPEAWLEDPPVAIYSRPGTGGRPPSWLERVALDGYVGAAADLEDPPIPPAAVNVKMPRVGGVLEALRCLERCARGRWHAYIGGMFEVGVGRRQARELASLFTSDSWNDLAPLEPVVTEGDRAG